MKGLDRLERMLRRHYIRDLMKYLCIAMLGVFILEYLPLQRSAWALMYFDRELILQGQVWRLFTFLFLPPTGSVLWILLNLYFYYFLGSSLERSWGGPRFNLYYLIGWAGAVLGGFVAGYASNTYLNTSLLLSYAILNPETEFMLFFFLPVKARWLGMIAGAYLIYEFIIAAWPMKALIVLSLLPFFLFFGKQAWLQTRMDLRRLRRWITLKIGK